jgi:hypothetical protein
LLRRIGKFWPTVPVMSSRTPVSLPTSVLKLSGAFLSNAAANATATAVHPAKVSNQDAHSFI